MIYIYYVAESPNNCILCPASMSNGRWEHLVSVQKMYSQSPSIRFYLRFLEWWNSTILCIVTGQLQKYWHIISTLRPFLLWGRKTYLHENRMLFMLSRCHFFWINSHWQVMAKSLNRFTNGKSFALRVSQLSCSVKCWIWIGD